MAGALCAQLSPAQQNEQTPEQQSASPPTSTSMAMEVAHLSELKGAKVKSYDGQRLGKIEDILVDPQTGRITFAIVGKGGLLDLGANLRVGDKRVPVPWKALRFHSHKELTLNLDKERFRSAPTVKSDYSNFQSPDFAMNVYKFYSLNPAEAVGAPGEAPGGSEGGAPELPGQPKEKGQNPNK